MLNITAGNISSVISNHLIQFLIESFSSNAKLEQTSKMRRWYKNFDKRKIKNDLQKISWKENCSNPDSNVAVEYFLQIINKLPDKHSPYIMSKSHSCFTSKHWITTAIANSIKGKTRFAKYFVKKKPQQKEIYGKQLRTYWNYLTTLLRTTKDEYYKTHFQGKKRLENDIENYWKSYTCKNQK